MPREDANRWNQRYRQPRYASISEPRAFLVQQERFLPNQGLALDIAMGLGANAGFLLEHGLKVVGVDISEDAAQSAKKRLPALDVIIADLTKFYLPTEKFDVILNFYYLQRDLWPEIRRALVPGGLLIAETMTVEMLQVQPEIDSKYLLNPGELHQAFGDWEVLDEREGWETSRQGHPRATASIAVRKLSLH